MAETYKSCFDFAYRYTFFSFLPPFTSRYGLGYLSLFVCFQSMIRYLLMITLEGYFDFGVCYYAFQLIQTTFNGLIYFKQRNGFNKYEKRINDFLEKNEINPYDHNGATFAEMWKKNKPVKIIRCYFWYQIALTTLWIYETDVELLSNDVKPSETPWGIYSPFLDRGEVYKWLYAMFDSISMLFFILNVTLQPDAVLISLLSFLKCQYAYLKLLLDEAFSNEERSDELNKHWIDQHVGLLNSVDELNHLLKPHIMIKYLSQVVGAISIVVSLSDSSSSMSLEQKVIEIISVVPWFMMLGYECNLLEKALETHKSMYLSLYRSDILHGNRKETNFLKMLMLRSQKPIKITDYGFFDMCMANFKNIVVHTYEFYSAIVAVKKE